MNIHKYILFYIYIYRYKYNNIIWYLYIHIYAYTIIYNKSIFKQKNIYDTDSMTPVSLWFYLPVHTYPPEQNQQMFMFTQKKIYLSKFYHHSINSIQKPLFLLSQNQNHSTQRKLTHNCSNKEWATKILKSTICKR